ncbi:unnamed protein product, partial [Discosporangium mesarthrocarpum]
NERSRELKAWNKTTHDVDNEVCGGHASFTEAAAVWLTSVGIEATKQANAANIRVSKRSFNSKDNSLVKTFLNRMLGMTIRAQTFLFDYFHAVLENVVKEAKRDGTFEDGILCLTGRSCVVDIPRPLTLPQELSVEDGAVRSMYVTVDRSIPWEEILPMYHEAKIQSEKLLKLAVERHNAMKGARGLYKSNHLKAPKESLTGFWKNKNVNNGIHYVLLSIDYQIAQSDNFTGLTKGMSVFSPVTGQRIEANRDIFASRRKRVTSLEEAEMLWRQEALAPALTERRSVKSLVFEGKILPIWKYVETSLYNLQKERSNNNNFIRYKCHVVLVQPKKHSDSSVINEQSLVAERCKDAMSDA